MPETIELLARKWWRFKSYELVDGFIRPREGAKLETFDPWQEMSDNGKPPYLTLTRLVESLSISSDGTEIKIAKSSEKELLDWCCRFGLLGLLPQQVLMFVLAPRWELVNNPFDMTLVPTQRCYLRTSMEWAGSRAVYEGKTAGRRRADQVVFFEKLPDRFQQPGVLFQDLSTGEIKQKSFTEAWRTFFPYLTAQEREAFRYPVPPSEAFWRMYAEPFSSFWKVATLFRETVEVLGYPKDNRTKSVVELDEGVELDKAKVDPLELMQGHRILCRLLESISPGFGLENDRWQQVWPCNSLLAAFALMYVHDLTSQNKYIRSCKMCSHLFTTSAWRGRFCTDACRWKMQKKIQRARANAPKVTSGRKKHMSSRRNLSRQ